MKAPNQTLFDSLALGIILLVLLLTPVSLQAEKDESGGNTGQPSVTADESLLQCPARVDFTCVPHLVGAVVLCTQGDEVTAYDSISDYCLGCHASSPSMTFEHPYEVEYPGYRKEFRELSALNEDIVLESGDLNCKTCHSGTEADNHYLVEIYESDRICGHCHVTGVKCPDGAADVQSVCFPGRLNGGTRCVSGEDIILHLNTSEFCINCHSGIGRFHSVDVEYPLNRPGFRDIADLDPRIKLEEGYVTCESCHEKKNEGMMLCVHCHPR